MFPISRALSMLGLVHFCLGLSGNILDFLPCLLHHDLHLPSNQETAFHGFAQEWAGHTANNRGHSFQHGG
jgi:hypothetical protein